MSVLGHTLWIILILFADSLLSLDCKAAIETKEIWMEDDEDSHAKFLLKPERRLLDSGGYNYEPKLRDTPYYYSSHSDYGTIIYVLVALLLATIVALIKCCIKYASEAEEEVPVRIVHPPPARTSVHPSVYLPSGSRPLAPPMTSRSLILLPEERSYQTLFIGIENPAFDTITSTPAFDTITSTPTPIQQERRKINNPTSLLDPPPDYDAVITGDSTTHTINISNDNEMEPPPKYEDS